MRFTVEEYSQAFSISPEMVQSRLRRNRLNYIVENETTYIVVPRHQVPERKEETTGTQKKTTVATVINLYQKENHYLKLKIKELEEKVDRLVSEKEQLLKDERERIEKVYTDKDTQLKTILELINTKLLQENASSEITLDDTNIAIEAKVESNRPEQAQELKQYLRSLGMKSGQRKIIKRRFAEAFGTDSRILLKNGLFYLDFERFDYSDLLKIDQA